MPDVTASLENLANAATQNVISDSVFKDFPGASGLVLQNNVMTRWHLARVSKFDYYLPDR